jgi:alpha-1,2-mannosyltransferase
MKSDRFNPLLLLFLAGMLAVQVAVFWSVRNLIRAGYPDFTIFYSAGNIVRTGMGTQLYDDDTQYSAQKQFAAGVHIRQGPLPYNHPPFEALLFVPFTYLPYFTAYILWGVVNLLILLALPLLLRPHVSLLQRGSPVLWSFMGLAFFPVFVALLQGQDVLVLLLLLTLAFVALKKNSDFAAGCWLGLGLFRFHLVLPIVFMLLLQKRTRLFGGFLSAALALLLISVAVVGVTTTWNYPWYVWRIEQAMGRGSIVPSDMPNLRGLMDGILTAWTTPQFTNIIVVAVSLILVLFAVRRLSNTAQANPLPLGFAFVVLTTVLVSYHAFAYDLSLLLLPVWLVVNHSVEGRSPRDLTKLALLGPVLVLFFSPLLMLLWLRYGRLNLLAPVLLVWWWGISRAFRIRPIA